MKKLILSILVIFCLSSCNQEDDICNCGTVIRKNSTHLYIWVKNECTENERKFYVTQDEYINSFINEYVCLGEKKGW